MAIFSVTYFLNDPKGVYFLAAKEYNTLPLQARRTDSRLLFRQFLDIFFKNNFQQLNSTLLLFNSILAT